MPRPLRIVACALGAWLCGIGPMAGFAVAADDYAYFHEGVLGTSCELRVRADSEAAARWAEGRVLGEVERLAALFSGYDPASEFQRWQETVEEPSSLSPELFEVLQA